MSDIYRQHFPGKDDLLYVRRRIQSYVHQTPVLTSNTLDSICGSHLFFKCENFQKAGAFKFRGATNAIMSIGNPGNSGDTVSVATHSSGNHAQALSLAARMRNLMAYIVMPENAPKVKVDAVRDYGGNIIFCKPTLQAREETLAEVLARTGAIEIHPYNDYHIIAGQSTVAAEMLETCPDLDVIVAPVGGGGLLSGTILSCRYLSPKTMVYGAEPENANDAWKSFRTKSFVPSINPKTIADGLRTSLGSRTFPIVMEGATDILTISEEHIKKAMMLIWERMKVVVEPSAAVPLGVILAHKELFRSRRVGVILSGGNIDLEKLPF